MVVTGVHDWSFAFYPVMANSALLVLAGMVYRNTWTGRPYPHPQLVAPPAQWHRAALRRVDLESALSRYNQVLAMPVDDFLRNTCSTMPSCRPIGAVCAACAAPTSSRDLKTAGSAPLQDAWACCAAITSRRCRWSTARSA